MENSDDAQGQEESKKIQNSVKQNSMEKISAKFCFSNHGTEDLLRRIVTRGLGTVAISDLFSFQFSLA